MNTMKEIFKRIGLIVALAVFGAGFVVIGFQCGRRYEHEQHEHNGAMEGRKFVPCTVDLLFSSADGKVYKITEREMGCNVRADVNVSGEVDH